MIDLETNSMLIKNDMLSIHHWETWFMTPFGIFVELDVAIVLVKKNDMDPNLVIRPVPVAICENNDYEVILR